MAPSTFALAEHLVRTLDARGWTLALGESCTGGLLGATLTAGSGVSTVFTHGFVCYSNMAKMDILGVAEQTMIDHGSVSEPVAIEMAEGAAAAARTDVGLGLTGIAGPTGGTKDKPVGLVFGALCVRGTTFSKSWKYDGNRTRIREESVKGLLSFANLSLKTSEALRRH